MKRFTATIAAISLGTLAAFGPLQARAQSAPADTVRTAPAALDPAMQRLFMTLALATLSNFASSAARGSLDTFDPGPAIESALKGLLSSRDLNAVIERLVEQAGAGTEETAASPEMRAMLKAALGGMVAIARSEIAREFSSAPHAHGGTGMAPAAPSMIP